MDGQRLAWALGDGRLGVSEVVRRTEYRTLNSYQESTKGPWGADFSGDGRLLASAHSDGVRLWDLQSGREAAFIVHGQGGRPLGYVRSAVLDAGGRRMITCGPDSGLAIWPIVSDSDPPGGNFRIGPPRWVNLPDGTECYSTSLDASRRILAVADRGRGQVILLDLENGISRPLPSGHPKIAFVTISPDGRWIASGSSGLSPNRIKVANVEGKVPDWKLVGKFPDAAVSIAFSPDSKWLVTGVSNESQVWEVETWKPVTHLQTAGAIGPMAFTADGKLLAMTQSRQQIKLYDAANEWKEIAALEASSPAQYSSLVFSPDGSQLAAVSVNHVIHLWDLRGVRERLGTMKLDWEHAPYSVRRIASPGPLRVTVLSQ
jgi:WD40 repeat protein